MMNEADRNKIKIYISMPQTQGTVIYKSSYIATLLHARKETGRNEATGKYNGKIPEEAGSWLGALAYLILIDHIGKNFKPAEKQSAEGNSFVKALKYFSQLSDKEINVLYSLRCSFAHDFGLYNDTKTKYTDILVFTMHQDHKLDLVTFSRDSWDGTINGLSNTNRTSVNIVKLGELVEEMHRTIVSLLDENKLDVYNVSKLTSLNMIKYRQPK